MEKLKIALFHPWIKSRGGAERLILEWLKRTMHDVDIYTWAYLPDKTYDEFKQFNITVIKTPFQKHLNSFITRGLSFGFTALTKKIDLTKYDLLLYSTAGVAELMAIKNHLNKTIFLCYTPLRAALKDDIKWNLKNRFKNPIIQLIYLLGVLVYTILEKRAWKNANKVIFDSVLAKNRALDKKLIIESKTSVIYPAVDLKKSTIKPKNSNYFLYVARIGMAKRQLALINGWKKFVEHHPEYQLYLVGSIFDSSASKYVTKVKHAVETTKNVILKTDVSDTELDKLYSEATACLNVPFHEDFGIVPFEVVAHNKPLISVDFGGFVELLKNHKGIVWLPETLDNNVLSERIYSALEEFISKKDKISKMAKYGKKFIQSQNLTWDSFAKQLDEVLNENIGECN